MGSRSEPSDSDCSKSALPESIGICVKDPNGRVYYQNRKCVEVCGLLAGEVCRKSCMRRYADNPEGFSVALGTHVELGILSDDGNGHGELIDAVVINDSRAIITILSPVPEKILKARAAAKECKLTPSQQRVFDLVLQGQSNREIAKALFISIPTVRTHLTRIYEKMPKDLLRLLLSGSTRLLTVP